MESRPKKISLWAIAYFWAVAFATLPSSAPAVEQEPPTAEISEWSVDDERTPQESDLSFFQWFGDPSLDDDGPMGLPHWSSSTDSTMADLTSTNVAKIEKTCIVLASTIDGTVYALDSESGHIKWSLNTGGPMVSTEWMDTIGGSNNANPRFIPGVDGSLYFPSPKGFQKYPVTAREIVTASPVMARDGAVLLGEKVTEMNKVNPETGDIQFCTRSAATGKRQFTGMGEESPINRGKKSLVIGRSEYHIRSVNEASGLELWNLTYGEHSVFLHGDADDPFSVLTPSIARKGRDLQLDATVDGLVYRVANGRTRWETRLGSAVTTLYSFSVNGDPSFVRHPLSLVKREEVEPTPTPQHEPLPALVIGRADSQLFAHHPQSMDQDRIISNSPVGSLYFLPMYSPGEPEEASVDATAGPLVPSPFQNKQTFPSWWKCMQEGHDSSDCFVGVYGALTYKQNGVPAPLMIGGPDDESHHPKPHVTATDMNHEIEIDIEEFDSFFGLLVELVFDSSMFVYDIIVLISFAITLIIYAVYRKKSRDTWRKVSQVEMNPTPHRATVSLAVQSDIAAHPTLARSPSAAGKLEGITTNDERLDAFELLHSASTSPDPVIEVTPSTPSRVSTASRGKPPKPNHPPSPEKVPTMARKSRPSSVDIPPPMLTESNLERKLNADKSRSKSSPRSRTSSAGSRRSNGSSPRSNPTSPQHNGKAGTRTPSPFSYLQDQPDTQEIPPDPLPKPSIEVPVRERRMADNKPPTISSPPFNPMSPPLQPAPTTLDSLLISRFHVEYESLGKLGRGGFGVVLKVRNKLDRCEWAIKRIWWNTSGKAADDLKVLREVLYLAKLDHPNIVRYNQAWLEELHNYETDEEFSDDEFDDEWTEDESTMGGASSTDVSKEYSIRGHSTRGGGDKHQFLDLPGGKRDPNISMALSEVSETSELSMGGPHLQPSSEMFGRQIALFIQMQLYHTTLEGWIENRQEAVEYDKNLFIFREIANGLKYIHQKGMIHRDLKPSNIFLNEEEDRVCVGDFGLVTLKKGESKYGWMNATSKKGRRKIGRHTTGVGSPLYASPEQISGKRYNEKVDIFSLGIIFFELYNYFGSQHERIDCITKLRQGTLPKKMQEELPEESKLLLRLVSNQPKDRPSAAELLEHPLLAKSS